MLDLVARQAGREGVLDRLTVGHADLGRVEWPGTWQLAEDQAARYGLRFELVTACRARSSRSGPVAADPDRRDHPCRAGAADRDLGADPPACPWPAGDLRRRRPDRGAPPGRDRRRPLRHRLPARTPRRLRADRGLLGTGAPAPALAHGQPQTERGAPPGGADPGSRAPARQGLSRQEARRRQVHQGGVPLPQTTPGASGLEGAARARGSCCFSCSFLIDIPSYPVVSQRSSLDIGAIRTGVCFSCLSKTIAD